jgi:hypothetical protein
VKNVKRAISAGKVRSIRRQTVKLSFKVVADHPAR